MCVMKKFVLPILPALLLLASFGPAAKVETFNYHVSLDGKPIGTYTVNKTEVNGTANFRIETVTSAGLLRRTDQKFVQLSSYEQSRLMSTDMKTWVNEKLESSSVLHWDGNQYVKQDGEVLTEICNEMITYSSACVYFEEPVDKESLFYEKFGADLKVRAIGNHQYEIDLPNGSMERYTYEKGKVVQVEFVQTFATIKLNVTS